MITAMNHCMYVEWVFMCKAAWPRVVRFSMEEANIKRKDLGWANRLLGGFGIPKDNPMAVAPLIRDLIHEGEIVHFFPEGYLKWRNQRPGSFQLGAAWFAALHNIPLVPVTEVLLKRPLHKLLPWWPPKIKLIIDPPIHPARYPQKRLKDRAEAMTRDMEELMNRNIRAHGSLVME